MYASCVLPNATENTAAIGKRESMQRLSRVVGDPMTIIEVTRTTLLKRQGQAGMGGIGRSDEHGTISQKLFVKRGKKKFKSKAQAKGLV